LFHGNIAIWQRQTARLEIVNRFRSTNCQHKSEKTVPTRAQTFPALAQTEGCPDNVVGYAA
jgi:hypothetical protein